MAKGNLLLGMGRGKLGDIVLYRQNGQQMSRPRVRVVKNPRTSGQQIQRMIQATIAYAYAGLKTIVDHSFEGVQYGGKSMNYFMKRNMDALRAQVIAGSNGANISSRFAIPNVRILYPNEYVVSNGSLPKCADPTGGIGQGADQNNLPFVISAPAGANITVGEFMAAFGASAGDQLTFLFLNYNYDDSTIVAELNDEEVHAVALAVRRIKFKSSYTSEELATAFALTSDCVDMDVTSDDLSFSVNTEGDAPILDMLVPSIGENSQVIGGCVIMSRKQGESWLRSPQTIKIEETFFSAEPIFGFTLSTAYNAWMAGTTPVGVSEYILNGKPNTDTWPEVDDEEP